MSYQNLIIVCCHAIYPAAGEDLTESQWVLQPFQASNDSTGKPGEHETFILHIKAGFQDLQNDPSALLVFSGGRTITGYWSEAKAYLRVLSMLPDHDPDLEQRILLEEAATDSYQNLLFSILAFRRHVGVYPSKVTVITHAFKERRFLELHGPAIKWPAQRIRVQGLNTPFTWAELKDVWQSEEKRGYDVFVEDPYGVRPPLSEKRISRHWKAAAIEELSFPELEPEVKKLLEWEGGESGREIFLEKLPWELDGKSG
jgi:hypothetical protein